MNVVVRVILVELGLSDIEVEIFEADEGVVVHKVLEDSLVGKCVWRLVEDLVDAVNALKER